MGKLGAWALGGGLGFVSAAAVFPERVGPITIVVCIGGILLAHLLTKGVN
jgi:hypothetical protein